MRVPLPEDPGVDRHGAAHLLGAGRERGELERGRTVGGGIEGGAGVGDGEFGGAGRGAQRDVEGIAGAVARGVADGFAGEVQEVVALVGRERVGQDVVNGEGGAQRTHGLHEIDGRAEGVGERAVAGRARGEMADKIAEVVEGGGKFLPREIEERFGFVGALAKEHAGAGEVEAGGVNGLDEIVVELAGEALTLGDHELELAAVGQQVAHFGGELAEVAAGGEGLEAGLVVAAGRGGVAGRVVRPSAPDPDAARQPTPRVPTISHWSVRARERMESSRGV